MRVRHLSRLRDRVAVYTKNPPWETEEALAQPQAEFPHRGARSFIFPDPLFRLSISSRASAEVHHCREFPPIPQLISFPQPTSFFGNVRVPVHRRAVRGSERWRNRG
jgi:hypothetical protein